MPAPYISYVSYAPEGRLLLRAAIEAAKAGDPLAPVTVAVPSNYAGLSLRQDLASQPAGSNAPAGLLNVRFMVLARVAELAGAPRLAAQGRRPLTTPFRMEAVRSVLLANPGPFAGLDPEGAGATERSLDRTFRNLDRCTDAELATLEAQGTRAAHVVTLYRKFRDDTRDFYDDRDLAEAAADAVRGGDAALTDIGHVIGYLLPAPVPAERAFLDALAERGRARVFAGLTGDDTVDNATRRSWADVAIEAAPDIREVGGTGVVLVNDAEEEVREAIREVAARVERGLPLHRVAFLYRHASPYALIAAEQLEVAGLPWNGPATRRLAQTAAGRTLLGFLALHPSDYRREAVSTWLTSAPIREQAGGRLVDGHRWDGFAREAGVIGGREQWHDRLRSEYDRRQEELAAMEATDREDDAGSEARIAGLRRRIDDMAAMREFIDELFQRSAPEDATSWLAFANWGKGLLARYVGHEPGGAPEEEVEAHRAIVEALEELGNLDDFQTPPSLAAFTAAIERALDRPAKRVGRFGHGVFLGRLSDAAGADFDLVVVLGMNEGAIPAAGRED
ncbi:MAG: hypothetical protein GEU80_14130, partial [Dehalococcoidia bacterium]|nr:hypothetical protein [Dehalococcoidia bacterium]